MSGTLPRWLPLVCAVLVAASPLRAQSAPPEGGIFLLLPVGAKAVALGRAMTAQPGAESVFWNPAGLSELSEGRLLLYRGDYVAGSGTAASGLMSRAGIGAVGLTYQLLDVGEQDLTDEQGNVLGTITVRNHLGVASVATRVFDRLNIGFNFKVVQFRQSCRGQCLDAGVTATTYAVDAGIQFTRLAGLPLRVGAMVAHAGPRFQIRNEEQADPLPTRMRVSAAYEVLGQFVEVTELELHVTGEVEDRWHDPGSPALYLGTEFGAVVEQALLVARAGYVKGNGEQLDGAAVGVGLRYDRFDVGVAKSLAATITGETEPVHVTFGLVF
ncbi:MAG: hypothetical protein OXI46_05170 [Gemmatimonadota bacterium]|nr:hypothetical protein [Gemmatimonadota bacterium]